MNRPLALLVLFAAALPACAAAPLHLESGPDRVALLELYTSEGCSSCPPAEQWLSGLRDSAHLWRTFVPVSYHVNYWDHLGWKDRFSSPAYTQRQYAQAAEWGTNSVYTPCFVRNGEEWRPAGSPDAGRPGQAGRLVVDVDLAGRCAVDFRPDAAAAGDLVVHLAVVGGGFVSKVTAGENRGSTLTHDFVALGAAAGRAHARPGRVLPGDFGPAGAAGAGRHPPRPCRLGDPRG